MEKEEITKKCSACGRVLPLSDFVAHKSAKDGHGCYCKECHREHARESYRRKVERKKHGLVETRMAEDIKRDDKVDLLSVSTPELVAALRQRGISVLIDPTPREMILRLKDLGYTGTLEFTVKKTISLSTFN